MGRRAALCAAAEGAAPRYVGSTGGREAEGRCATPVVLTPHAAQVGGKGERKGWPVWGGRGGSNAQP